jgi:hypothetical protein
MRDYLQPWKSDSYPVVHQMGFGGMSPPPLPVLSVLSIGLASFSCSRCFSNSSRPVKTAKHLLQVKEGCSEVPIADDGTGLFRTAIVVPSGRLELYARLTRTAPNAAQSPESGEIDLKDYEGRAIMVCGYDQGAWIYAAEIIDTAGPLLSALSNAYRGCEGWEKDAHIGLAICQTIHAWVAGSGYARNV